LQTIIITEAIRRSPSTPLSLFLAACNVLMQDTVLAIPGRPEWTNPAGSFHERDHSHREQIWVTTVSLSLSAIHRRPGAGYLLQVVPCTPLAVLVNRLREFTFPEVIPPVFAFHLKHALTLPVSTVRRSGTSSGERHAYLLIVPLRPSSNSSSQHHHAGVSGTCFLDGMPRNAHRRTVSVQDELAAKSRYIPFVSVPPRYAMMRLA
jgi:hypothetical protein